MKQAVKFVVASVLALAVVRFVPAQAASASTGTASFPPLQQWTAAVLTADADTLKALYSTNPPAQISIKTVNAGRGRRHRILAWPEGSQHADRDRSPRHPSGPGKRDLPRRCHRLRRPQDERHRRSGLEKTG